MTEQDPASPFLIAAMNDSLDRNDDQAGFIVLPRGVRMLDQEAVGRIVNAVCEFTDFTRNSDPDGEHDFGVVYVEEKIIFWTIDHYDASPGSGSEDPTSDGKTRRVLTIMLREEY